jgi:iron complex outermembrane receptor protein
LLEIATAAETPDIVERVEGILEAPEFLTKLEEELEAQIGNVGVVYSGDLYADNANLVKVSSYTVANLRFSIDIPSGKWLFRTYAGINNLFDESYNNNIRINAFGGRYFEPAPGRNVYVGIIVNHANTRSSGR